MQFRNMLRSMTVAILLPAAFGCATRFPEPDEPPDAPRTSGPPGPTEPPVIAPVPLADAWEPLVVPFRPAADDILRDLAAWDAASAEARTARAASLLRQLPGFVLSGLLRFECGEQRHQVAVFHHERTGLEFVLVPCGKIAARAANLRSGTRRREFVVDAPYLIARTEVTRRAFESGQSLGPGEDAATSAGDADDPDVPVGGVSGDRALAWCREMGFDLPSEAQWEFASRGGAETRFGHGDDPAGLGAYAWTSGNSGDRLHRAGEKLPNALGLHDVHGNACEWSRKASPDAAMRSLLGPSAESDADAGHRRRCPDAAEWMFGFRPVVTIPARAWDPAPGRAIRRVTARGVQMYRLDRRSDQTLAWTFVGPRAELLDAEGRVVGDHFLAEDGPCWEIGNDCIFARKAVERPSRTTGSIPELQLDVTDMAGDGLFDGVVTIERIDTVGGAAPEGAGSNVEGDLVEIPYTATYDFYAAPGPGTAPTDVTLRSAR